MTQSSEPWASVPAPRDSLPATPAIGVSISAVVPTFNDVRRLADSLTAIVEQTVPPLEVIVADDGSEDGTEQFVRQFAATHADRVPVRYVRLPSRSGVVAARNEAISLARGEWIATCDSDDVWAPGKLERQIDCIRGWGGGTRIALLGTYGYNMNDAKRVISPAIMGPASEADYEQLHRTGGLFYLIHSSVMYRRADFEALGGYTTEYGAADDFDFFCRMAGLGVVMNLPEHLVYYRKRSGSIQLERFWNQRQGVLRLAENERRRARSEAPLGAEEFAAQLAASPALERLRRRRRLLGMYYYRLGANNMVNGRRPRGACELALASILDPRRLRSSVLGAVRGRRSRPAAPASLEPPSEAASGAGPAGA
jgi:GT2 family glycosyltransferase